MSEFFERPDSDAMPKDMMELLQNQKHELKFIGKTRVVPGHTMFSYNIRTGEIKVAPIKYDVSLDYRTRKPVRKGEIVIEKDCIYRYALNRKNFIKRLKREFFGFLTAQNNQNHLSSQNTPEKPLNQ